MKTDLSLFEANDVLLQRLFLVEITLCGHFKVMLHGNFEITFRGNFIIVFIFLTTFT